MSTTVAHPSVIWAQRKNCVFLTICLDDCKDPEIKTEAGSILFKGQGGSDKKQYEANIEFFANVDPSSSLHVVRPRNIEFCLKKAEDSFWPRLTKSQAKCPWLKVDFNKWKDEDDSDEEGGPGRGGMGGMGGMPGMGGMGMGGPGGDGTDFEEMMRQMGGLGGMPGGGKPSLDDLDNNQTDSDDEDEDLPDLE